MKIFTRSPWAYWGDRIFLAVLLCGVGMFFVIAPFMIVADGQTNLGPVPILGPVLGSIMFIAGIWAFFQPWPMRLEVDAKGVRIVHRPAKIVTIARNNILGATSRAVPRGGSAFGIVYKDNTGKVRGVKLYGGWRSSDGILVHSMTKELNTILGTTPPPTPWF